MTFFLFFGFVVTVQEGNLAWRSAVLEYGVSIVALWLKGYDLLQYGASSGEAEIRCDSELLQHREDVFLRAVADRLVDHLSVLNQRQHRDAGNI